MKLKIFWAVLFTSIALAAGWNYSQSKNNVELNDLALANVEALAWGETGGDHCFRIWYQEDAFGGTGTAFIAKVCETCYFKYLNSASGSSTCNF